MNRKVKQLLRWNITGFLLLLLLFCKKSIGMAKTDQSFDAKNAIVKLYTGYVENSDTTGAFWSVKESSGCLVSNTEGSVYLIAPYHSMMMQEQERKDFCNANHLKKEDVTLARKVVISGDMRADVEVVTTSKEQDFCLLSVENVIQEKEAVHFATQGSTKVNDSVVAVGFPTESAQGARFDKREVVTTQGNVVETADYIRHTATIDPGMAGGALINKNGYFIGMNNIIAVQNEDSYSLNSSFIQNLLDNRGIVYESEATDKARQALDQEIKKCKKILTSSKYKASSLESLTTAMEEVNRTLDGATSVSKEQAEQLTKQLVTAGSLRKKKTSVLFIAIIVVGIVDGILLIILFFFFHKLHKKKNTVRQLQSKMQGQKQITPVSGGVSTDHSAIQQTQPPQGRITQQDQILPTEQMGTSGNNAAGQQPVPQDIYAASMKESDVQGNILRRQQPVSQGGTQGSAAQRQHRVKENAFLHRMQDDSFCLITKTPFLIGKNAEAVDYCIPGNRNISRIHASIQRYNGNYILYDMHSVNGTFVNGVKLQTEPITIKHGDQLRIANEVFEFIIQKQRKG